MIILKFLVPSESIYRPYPLRLVTVFLMAAILPFCAAPPDEPSSTDQSGPELEALVRSQKQTADGWTATEEKIRWTPENTAIVICDMWDRHWCDSATARVAAMAPHINSFVTRARNLGVTIVHAPSSTIEFYKDHPARKRVLEYPKIDPPITLDYWFHLDSTRESALPIDDSDEGCDSPGNQPYTAWTRQIEDIEILAQDIISDSGQEIYNYFQAHDISNVVLCGVHTNMCVLGRTFGVRGQVKLGNNVLLARDLTDAMYNPEMAPYVSHRAGTDLVVGHIEKYWAPSVLSTDLIDRSRAH